MPYCKVQILINAPRRTKDFSCALMNSSKSNTWVLDVFQLWCQWFYGKESRKKWDCACSLASFVQFGSQAWWQLCAMQQCNSWCTVILLDQLWEPKSTLESSPVGRLSGIIRAAVCVSARCRLHSWGLTLLCRYGQQDGAWKSCPLPPLRNGWELSDWNHSLDC